MALHDPQSDRAAAGSNDNTPFFAQILARESCPEPVGLKVAGITISERQRRQLHRLGASAVDDRNTREARRLGPLLVIEAGLVADERLIQAFVAQARRAPSRRPLVALGPDGEPGGLAWLPAPDSSLDWSEIIQEAQPVDLSGTPTYSPERRRHVPLLWQRPRDAGAARETANQVLAAAQKGCLDWPARFIHPPVENAAVRLLWSTPVTPNLISLLAFLLGLYAAWCFATGNLWTGLVLALVIGPIDGIDGKLARSRMEFSRWGDLEHVGDKIVEYAWFAGLASAIGTGAAWALAALIVVTALAEALQGEFFRRVTGTQLDDCGPFERGYRLVSGRRNTFFWSLLPFALFDAWAAGLVMIAVYATVNFFIMQARFFLRLAEFGRANSPLIAENLDATAYIKELAEKSGEESSAPTGGGPRILPSTQGLELS